MAAVRAIAEPHAPQNTSVAPAEVPQAGQVSAVIGSLRLQFLLGARAKPCLLRTASDIRQNLVDLINADGVENTLRVVAVTECCDADLFAIEVENRGL